MTLKPEQEVSFRLPRYQSVRLYSPNKKINPEDIKLTLSDGTGLAFEESLYESTDGYSLVLSPQASKPLLVHIQVNNNALKLGLFVSRTVSLDEIAPYRNVIPFSKNWVLLSTEAYQIPELYWRLPKNKTQKITLTGDAKRIVLRHRLQFEKQAHDLIQDYRIHYRLDKNEKHAVNLATSVDSSYELEINFKTAVLSRTEETYIEIPTGEHTLEFSADRALYLQVLTQTEHDYLFPNLNEPHQPVEEIRKHGLLPTQPQVLKAQQSKQLAEDNSLKEAEMFATQQLKQTALQRPDYPPLMRESEQLRGFRTFYRDLLPNHKNSEPSQYLAYFTPKRLLPYQRTQHHPTLAPQHLQAVLKRIGKTIFTPLSNKGASQANEYFLPPRSTASELRLVVDKSFCEPKQSLWVQFDDQQPKALEVRCDEKNIHLDDFVQTFFEVAVKDYQHLLFDDLSLIKKEPPDKNKNPTPQKKELSCSQFERLQPRLGFKSKPCASLEKRRLFYRLIEQHFKEGALIDSATVELSLAKKIKRIKIWRDESSTQPVAIAVQYRSAKSFVFSEQSFLARLQETNPAALLTQFKHDLLSPLEKPKAVFEVENQLKNQWLPLVQLIQAQARLYKAAVALPESKNTHRTNAKRLAQLYRMAKQNQAQNQWVESLELWAKIVQHTEGLERHRAQFEQANLLHLLGESYLAETLWRYLFFYADEPLANKASEKLRFKYQQQHNNFALQSLAASEVLKQPSRANLEFLLETLLKNKEYRFGLLLGLTLMEQPPLALLLKAAYQLQWWQSYQHLIEPVPLKKQAFWNGLKFQTDADYVGALATWKTEKPLWSESLLKGLQLRDKVARSCGKHEAEYYQQWLTWQNQQPSEKHWQTANHYFKDYAGADTYYSPERDVYSKGFRATAERPLQLSLLGGRTLKFKIRPLHPANVLDSAVDGWVEIKDRAGENRIEQHQLYPFTNNTPSQGLELTSVKVLQLGGLVELEYQLGAGWHELAIYSQQATLSITMEESQAQMPLTVLPRLNPYSFRALWQLPQLPMLTQGNLALINPFRATNFPSLAKGSHPLHLLKQAIRNAEHLLTLKRVKIPFTPLKTPLNKKECFSTKNEDITKKLKTLPFTPSDSLTISAKVLTVAEVLNLEKISNLKQAKLRMMHYVRLFEADAAGIEKILLPAEKLRVLYLNDALIQSLWQRIARFTQWQTVESVESNAGLRFIDIEGWQPESPFIRTRKALLPYVANNEHLIFSDQRLVLFSQNLKRVSLHIEARLNDVPFLPEVDAYLFYRIDEKPPQKIHLKRQQGWQTFTVYLPKGEHSLRFYQPKALGNQFVKLRFDDHVSDLSFTQERGYFVSTKNEPVKINLQGSTRLRIDEWVNESEYQAG
ncbi:MAG: hypothetical protein Q9M50_02290 [Methylococcales bacterium]|nr:hypothetical protein [Methylococcales bacterium]